MLEVVCKFASSGNLALVLLILDPLQLETTYLPNTVKLGNKERFDKEQIGIKELIMDYQPFYTINLLLDKELLPI